MKYSAFPVASIIFEGDYRLGVLQALSIDRLYEVDAITEYTVILNGRDNDEIERCFTADALDRVSEKLRSKTVLLRWEDLLGDAPRVGYYDQQALKLALGTRYSSELFLMLDAKNHFVRPTSAADFFIDGKPYSPLGNTGEYWEKYLKASMDVVGNTTADQSKMLPSITPYMMYTTAVKEVTDLLKGKFGKSLPEAMRTGGGTEFLLYYAHIEPRLKDLYTNRQLPVRTLFTSWPQDSKTVGQFINDLSDKNIPMFGLHRKRIPQLTDEQKAQVSRMWSRYLLAPWEDPNWFLSVD